MEVVALSLSDSTVNTVTSFSKTNNLKEYNFISLFNKWQGLEFFNLSESIKDEFKSSFLLDIEDLDTSVARIINENYDEINCELSEYMNKYFGNDSEFDIIVPNYDSIFKLHEYIESHRGEKFVVACEYGASRSIQVVNYLLNLGYKLSPLGNQRIDNQGTIYQMLTSIHVNQYPMKKQWICITYKESDPMRALWELAKDNGDRYELFDISLKDFEDKVTVKYHISYYDLIEFAFGLNDEIKEWFFSD